LRPESLDDRWFSKVEHRAAEKGAFTQGTAEIRAFSRQRSPKIAKDRQRSPRIATDRSEEAQKR
jgi:hypothetical protein